MAEPTSATPAGTRRYFQRYRKIRTVDWPGRNLRVSRAGFGGYRISLGVADHREALSTALSSGINLIDTSSNYADGGSEELIGSVWRDLLEEEKIRRDEIVLVTKGGYIQGSNLRREEIMRGEGRPWSDVVDLGDQLHHSISPEFLEDQISQSLLKLDVEMIDCYLLHNPEYYLKWAEQQEIPSRTAQNEYRSRIVRAFSHLSEEVRRGRIASFGVSSNTFVVGDDSYEWTSLEMALSAAEDAGGREHLAAVQMPANLLERGYRSLAEQIHRERLLLIGNRPFNAIQEDRLIRLADFPEEQPRPDPEEIDAALEELGKAEGSAREEVGRLVGDPRQREAAVAFLHVAPALENDWRDLGPAEAFSEIISSYFAPRLSWLAELSMATPSAAIETCVVKSRSVLQTILAWHATESNRRNQEILDSLRLEDPETDDAAAAPLTHVGLYTLWRTGVDVALVGMRRSEYVYDVLGALQDE